MSHLTANPFQKHFEFPRPGPLTPPDTESEEHIQGLQPPPPPAPAPLALGIEIEGLPHSSHRSIPSVATEIPPTRKLSSLQYIHSGPREARERVIQRGIRWLVIVVPPLSVVTEHGHFGHTLAIGSPERLSQGMLMPLFPTMSGQLGAIAREFAFPSTAGLCLYLHTNVDGIAMTPRISDESWQMLWANLFEPRSPAGMTPTQLPIGGRIEFDIDLRKARWYEAWLGLSRRDLVDVPVSVTPSRPQSISHYRGDSRTTFLDDQVDEQIESSSLLLARPSRAPGYRHIPRKLSLLDRLDSASIRSGSKLVPRNLSPPSPGPGPVEQGVAPELSPIVQEDEPKTARKDIDKLVNSWRVSASLAAGSPLALTGQTSLDPANLPNDLPIEDTMEIDEELDLDDFAWSVSSRGPPDYDSYDEDEDFESWRLPSVHLDRRMMGSVCLTPSTNTSWGPGWEDDDFSSVSSISRLPSPDIARRQLEDCPPTPSTATSWGPPSYPASPATSELSITQSVDIGQRCAGSVPVTPSTATSWGPPLEWPASPATPYYVRTPDVGQRSFDADQPQPWHHVWPYQPTSENGDQSDNEQSGQYPFVFPYYDPSSAADVEEASSSQPWTQVWPYNASSAQSSESSLAPYPFVFPYYHTEESEKGEPWKQVWPYCPASSAGSNYGDESDARDEPHAAATTEHDGAPWSHVWPYVEMSSQRVVADFNYPHLCIYPAVYPHIELYPTAAAGSITAVALKELPVELQPSYPTVRPYAPGYPVVEPYPPVTLEPVVPVQEAQEEISIETPVSTKVSAAYPAIDIYPAVYPHNVYEIYASSTTSTSSTVTHDLPSAYPEVVPYRHVYPYNLERMYPARKTLQASSVISLVSEEKAPSNLPKEVDVRLPAHYPSLQLYSPGCPWSLDSIYPPKQLVEADLPKKANEGLKLASYYPSIDLYEPVYPWNLDHIYPAVHLVEPEREDPSAYPHNLKHIYSPSSHLQTVDVKLSSQYPTLDIYSAVYPWNLDSIYPSTVAVERCISSAAKTTTVTLPIEYPHLQFYSPVYPYNLEYIYPAVKGHRDVVSQPRASTKPVSYVARSSKPHLRDHSHHHAKRSSSTSRPPPPPVPPLPQNVEVLRPLHPTSRRPLSGERMALSLPVRVQSFYPTICLYPAAYPHFDLYPEHKATVYTEANPLVSVRLEAKYPVIEIYPAVYPFIELYPSPAAHTSTPVDSSAKVMATPAPTPTYLPRRQPKRTHDDLHRMVFGVEPKVVRFATEENVPVQQVTALPVPDASIHSPVSPRRQLPSTPPQTALPALPTTPSVDTSLSSPPTPVPSPSPRSRARSGTVSARPPLPTPPPVISTNPAQILSPIESPTTRSIRRLPAVPGDAASPTASPPSRRPMSMRVGLPASPASTRRMSLAQPSFGSSRSPPFAPLPPVPEPSVLSAPPMPSPASSPISPRRPLPPQPQTLSQIPESQPAPPELHRSNSGSAALLAPPSGGVADLTRAKSLPARPLPRARRDSVAVPSSGIVAGMARAYNASKLTKVDEQPDVNLSTLSQFPNPPRPPLPPLPNGRPVSKLDRSKYPFA